MRKSRGIQIKTYEELEHFAHAFAAGSINLLILVGSGGLQKSRTLREVVPSGSCWIQGNASPFGIYLKLYHFRDKLVIIDDVDSLSRNKDGVNLLKCLCQTDPLKTVSWLSATRQLAMEKVPREFTTASRVCIISNDWNALFNRNLAAVEDRGHLVHFIPSAEEIHLRTGEWFHDMEIYDWFGRQLHRISEPSMRHYYRALELKNAGLDWKKLTRLWPENPRRALVAEIMEDSRFETQEARAQEFIRRGGGCRATFFNHLRALRRRSSS